MCISITPARLPRPELWPAQPRAQTLGTSYGGWPCCEGAPPLLSLPQDHLRSLEAPLASASDHSCPHRPQVDQFP